MMRNDKEQGSLLGLLKMTMDNKLTIKQLLVLLHLDSPVKASQVAEICGVTMAGATGIIDRMEQAQYVRREHSKSDRRCIMVERTVAGSEALKNIINVIPR
jgi:DNA-binding MarR family transcriptional regulator